MNTSVFGPISNLVPLLILRYISYYVLPWLLLLTETTVLSVTLNLFVLFFPCIPLFRCVFLPFRLTMKSMCLLFVVHIVIYCESCQKNYFILLIIHLGIFLCLILIYLSSLVTFKKFTMSSGGYLIFV